MDTTKKAGYITQAKYIRSHSMFELADRLGFEPRLMSEGFELLFLIDRLSPGDFEFRGYTQMSGGVERGHLEEFKDGPNAEERLHADGYDVLALKEKICRETFKYQGPDRLCKVVPLAARDDKTIYPKGSGIPQWVLIKPKLFQVAAVIGPKERYLGNYT